MLRGALGRSSREARAGPDHYTQLRLKPGGRDTHPEEFDVYNGEVALVLQTAERSGSRHRYARVRTMACESGGWINMRYLLSREEYERQRPR